ncbi:MAG: DNA cytosine methyltransferase [Rhodothermales bacterium]
MLRAADLFSGIGGFSLALDCFDQITTALYCDICPVSRAILQKQMDRGALPRAPIHEDVTSLTCRPGEIDLIVGGFPCTGFSSLGKSDGIHNDGSGLINHVFRLVREAEPAVVFLENVPRIVRFPEYPDICGLFDGMGYDVHWIRVKASQFGAPHHRARWFCLCVRRGAQLPELTLRQGLSSLPLFDWSTEPRRTAPKSSWYRHRNLVLGNTVVPVAARVAFVVLWTGCRMGVDAVLGRTSWPYHPPARANDDEPPLSEYRVPMCGMYRDGRIVDMDVHPDIAQCRPHIRIEREFVLDASCYASPRPRKQTKVQADLMIEPHRMRFLSTPRTIMQSAQYLTKRSYKDLATQIRFERSTPDRHLALNNEFVEWMQGYPPGWTSLES